MPNPQFTKPWHGVPRENIQWNPRVIEEACIGCGTCVTGCSRLVYRFDYERKKPVVVDPLNCMVGCTTCTTCANTCPAHAIAFPPIETVLALEGLSQVRHAVEDDLLARHDILAADMSLPHPDRIVTLAVTRIDHPSADVLRVGLAPVTPGECFCEFSPGQYIELWQPGAAYLSRSYSIANASHGDGSLELHIRRVEGGRFTAWAFTEMKVGDQLQARGPLGSFTMRSAPDVPLLFIAGGTGLAPVLALLEQQANFAPGRDLVLVWGMRRASDFYALDTLRALAARAPGLRIELMAQEGATNAPALKQADVGIAVSSATDVAKAAASLVLTRPGLGEIIMSVDGSRRIYQRMKTFVLTMNTRKISIPLFLALGVLVLGTFVLNPLLMVLFMLVAMFFLVFADLLKVAVTHMAMRSVSVEA